MLILLEALFTKIHGRTENWLYSSCITCNCIIELLMHKNMWKLCKKMFVRTVILSDALFTKMHGRTEN